MPYLYNLAMMKRHLTVPALVLALVISLLTAQPAAALPSEWADYDIELARQYGLVNPYLLYYVDCADMLTKDMFCEMAVVLCEKLTGNPLPGDHSIRFQDDDWYIPDYFYQAYAAGIISGKGVTPDGRIILGKSDELKREEVFKMLYNAIVWCYPGEAVGGGEIGDVLSAFSDSAAISDWARESAAYMVKNGVVRGSNGNYLPKDKCTVEQGIVTVKRIFETFSNSGDLISAPLLKHDLDAPLLISPSGGSSQDVRYGVGLQWNPVEGASSYRIRFMTEWGALEQYTNKTSLTLEPWALNIGSNVFIFSAVDEARQTISKSAYLTLTVTGNKDDTVNINPKNEADYYFSFKSQAEAEAYMTTVRVNVWKINKAGEKYTDTIPITIHRYVASDVVSIFNEIYNGPEKFPIYAASGFAWRDGWGEHPKGTAIDINYNENYQIFSDGRIGAGSFWEPGESPYSIPIGGDVEQAFRKYGWGWGGTDWRSNNDYMHFSYFGT